MMVPQEEKTYSVRDLHQIALAHKHHNDNNPLLQRDQTIERCRQGIAERKKKNEEKKNEEKRKEEERKAREEALASMPSTSGTAKAPTKTATKKKEDTDEEEEEEENAAEWQDDSDDDVVIEKVVEPSEWGKGRKEKGEKKTSSVRELNSRIKRKSRKNFLNRKAAKAEELAREMGLSKERAKKLADSFFKELYVVVDRPRSLDYDYLEEEEEESDD